MRCASHTAEVAVEDEQLLITAGPAPLDRDLLLDVLDRPAGGEPQALWYAHDDRPRSDGMGEDQAAAIVPPGDLDDALAIPRVVTFLVDRSGSMKGAPMAAARRAVRESLRSLTAINRSNILAFDDRVEALADGPLPPTPEALAAAGRFLDGVDARGGARRPRPRCWWPWTGAPRRGARRCCAEPRPRPRATGCASWSS